MQITLYNFSKRVNSTKQPTQGTIKNVNLKSECSIYNPIFTFSNNETNFNYIKAWDRFYYVTDIKHTPNNYIEVSCSIDLLASYKSNILNTNAFVLFSTNQFNSSIVDNRLSSNKNVIVKSTTANLSFTSSLVKRHIVSYIGTNGSNYVALTDEALGRLVTSIQSNEFAELFNDPQNALAKVLTDTSSCITSCIYNPCTVTGAVKEVILAGGYESGVTGNAVNRDSDMEIDISIPWNFTDFRQRSQFTSLLLYLPGYGYQPLNADNYNGKDSIHIRANLDSVVGEITYLIDHKTKCSATLSSQEQISTTSSGKGSVLGMVANGVGALATGLVNPIGTFNTVVSSLETNPGSIGSNGGLTSFNAKHNITLYCISHNTNVEPSTLANNYGRPLNEVINIGSISGYCECANASVSAPTSQENIDVINNYLNGGVYIE